MMERLTEKHSTEYSLKILGGLWCNDYCEEQSIFTCVNCGIYQAIQKLGHYEELEESLRKAFGDCDGLLDEMVNSFVRHATAEAKEELKGAGKVRILTDEDADKWLRWRELEEDGKLIELPCKPGIRCISLKT